MNEFTNKGPHYKHTKSECNPTTLMCTYTEENIDSAKDWEGAKL